MADPILIVAPTFFDTMSVSASGAAPGAPASNLNKPQPTDFWEDHSPFIESYITVNLGTPRAIDVAALLYTNSLNGQRWQLRGATESGRLSATPDYTSGIVTHSRPVGTGNLSDPTFRAHLVHLLSTPRSYQWWQFKLDPKPRAHRAGVLVLGQAWRAKAEYGASWGGDVQAPIAVTDGGQRIPVAPWRQMAPRIDLSIVARSEAEHEEQAHRLLALFARRRPILVLRQPDNAFYLPNRVYWGLIEDMQPIVWESAQKWKWRLSVVGMV